MAYPAPESQNNHDLPPLQTCPYCGKPFDPGFDLDLSDLLDLVQTAHEAIGDVKAALETEVQP
jgi:hypothetical protein